MCVLRKSNVRFSAAQYGYARNVHIVNHFLENLNINTRARRMCGMKNKKARLNRQSEIIWWKHDECVKMVLSNSGDQIRAYTKCHFIISLKCHFNLSRSLKFYQVAISFRHLIEKYCFIFLCFFFSSSLSSRNRRITHAFQRIQWVKYRKAFTCMWSIVERLNYVRMRQCLVLIGQPVRPALQFWRNARNVTRANRSASAS